MPRDHTTAEVDQAVHRWINDREIIDDQAAGAIAAGWQSPTGDGLLFARFASAIAAGRWAEPEGLLDAIDRTITALPAMVAADPTGFVPGDLGTADDNIHRLQALAAHLRYVQAGLPDDWIDPVYG